MFGGDDLDTASLHDGEARSTWNLARDCSVACSLVSNRGSVLSSLSDYEKEHGWASSAGAMANSRMQQGRARKSTTGSRNQSRSHRPPTTYRPPFAPLASTAVVFRSIDDELSSQLKTMPALSKRVVDYRPPQQSNMSGLKKIMNAILPRAPSALKRGKWSLSRGQRHPRRNDVLGEPRYIGHAVGHPSSRLADYDEEAIRSMPQEMANIPLYAAPASAHVSKSAFALSSFAPRAPLRPPLPLVGGGEAPLPAQTLEQAARAYSIKRAQRLADTGGRGRKGQALWVEDGVKR